MQGLSVAIAKRINRLLGRSGRVFEDRYHARVIRTPRQTRAVLLYVLQNERHHAPDRLAWRAFDPYSSAMSFDGWAAPLPADEEWQVRALAASRATSPPTLWLLTTGWKRRGLLRLDEAPVA